jgi:hypothetical protein
VVRSPPFHRTSTKKDGGLIKPELPPVHLSQRPLIEHIDVDLQQLCKAVRDLQGVAFNSESQSSD